MRNDLATPLVDRASYNLFIANSQSSIEKDGLAIAFSKYFAVIDPYLINQPNDAQAEKFIANWYLNEH